MADYHSDYKKTSQPDSRATRNADSLTNAQGEFNPHKARDEPLTTHGHQPGQKFSAADNAPEFSAKTLPPGSAPASNTFQPNPIGEIPSQANNPDTTESVAALDMPGSTSADVHAGLGHPGQGQTSSELRHEGQHTGKKVGAGFEGAGAQGGSGMRDDKNREFARLGEEKGFGESGARTDREGRQGAGATLEGAEDKLNATASEVAAERD